MRETIMNPIRHIRRALAVLAGLTAAVLAVGATPAFARLEPDPGAGYVAPASAPAQVRTIVVGGMPGWQIALIAVGAALLAAALAVLADRVLAARRRTIPAAA
jgi:hypothetical protein